MPSRARHRMMFMVLALAMVATACGDTAADTTTTAAPATTTTTTAGDTTTSAAPGVSLAGVCPDPIVIQTDWFPEAEHGAIYELVGDDYTIDKDNKIVSGSLMAAGGVDTGIAIEVRTGGPAIGFQPVSTQMYTDTDVTIGYVSTDEAAAFFEDAPTIAVVSPLEKNPQIIMWDPDTYPDIKTIADLGEAGVTINVFAGGTFIEVFVAQGVVAREQVDPS
ncbi:MAG TPA: ABC transporter substrate-binding protein, partial [Acidimicrobiia bacterium]|nr:ABC transporter substrate-binding protein [Acidimicrobiia bacterium]